MAEESGQANGYSQRNDGETQKLRSRHHQNLSNAFDFTRDLSIPESGCTDGIARLDSMGAAVSIDSMVGVAKMVQTHYDGVVRWFSSKLTNGLLEGVNSIFQAAKRKARGYRSEKNVMAMVYILAGKLNFALK